MQEKDGPDIQPEVPAPMLESEVEAPPPVESLMEESPASSNRLRRILIWAVSLIVILAIGVILTWTLRVQPQAEQLKKLEADQVLMQDQLSIQSKELDSLRPLVEQNKVLKDELVFANAHLDLLTVLVDVTTAQLALAQEDDIAARAALTGTADRLEALEATLEGVNATEVREMGDRLQLVVEEVESDSFAARRDLEILANNLLALERVLFGE